ncbi:MAG: branched-chain amino acid ABC transporter permease, partial [Pseudomonadota bacterium]|nr:branched-chain amino acid ABC transporter permease [Pseudomonadota bacterium]
MTDMTDTRKSFYFHLGLIGLLFILQFILPAYHHGNLARIMVLACYAMGYNILFGYTGLLSLGHAMFFAAGMYGMGLPMAHLGWTPEPALVAGLVA